MSVAHQKRRLISAAKFRDELRAATAAKQFGSAVVDLMAENVRMVDQNSSFFGMFKSDEWTSYVEFDICHSLPVVAGPAYHTGNYTCWHPAALSRSHRGLVHKQTNLHHLIKSYDPEEISRDRIVGCIVMTQFPDEPADGWKIPDTKADAIPIRACAAIFKQAEGALEMLKDHVSGRQKWSISAEIAGNGVDQMAVYFPNQKKLVPFLDVPDDVLMESIHKDDCNCMCLGKFQGEQLALCYGAETGSLTFRGVGFTPGPAEKEARIRNVNLSVDDPLNYNVEEKPNGIFAMTLSSSREALARAAVQSCFKHARLAEVHCEGKAKLKDQFWYLEASEARPVLEIRLPTGKSVLRYLDELTKEAAA